MSNSWHVSSHTFPIYFAMQNHINFHFPTKGVKKLLGKSPSEHIDNIRLNPLSSVGSMVPGHAFDIVKIKHKLMNVPSQCRNVSQDVATSEVWVFL